MINVHASKLVVYYSRSFVSLKLVLNNDLI